MEDRSVRQACLVARVSARSSALAGLDDLDRQNREVNLAAVSANGIALQWAPASCRASNSCRAPATCWPHQERFKKDKGVALAAVTSAGHALKYVDKELQSDPDVVHAAIRQNALALHFASPRLQRDKDIVLEACQRDIAAFSFAADILREDKQFRSTTGVEFPSVDKMNVSTSSMTSCSSRSWFSASTCDGRWPWFKHWSYRPYLAASTAKAVSSAEASSRRKKKLSKRARLGKDKLARAAGVRA
ncbi:NEK1 [Symbiodinium necroappetens]|uniref:NEK1 protein n=1 Tax=Symbiodinium necroappetens TaxID=1628268 RepID=A0A813C7I0_9DINO|nr:NEK1 [Symbiodinium necroappetens]